MIVKSMNSRELINEITKDYPIVIRKAIYLTESMRREAVKSKSKYVYRAFDYKSQRQNNWIIIVNYFVDHPVFNIVINYIDDHGLNGIMVGQNLKTLSHYTPHFLNRYNERYLKQNNISKRELLKRYISQNAVGHVQYDEDPNTKDNRIFACYREGVGLGFLEKVNGIQNEIIHYKTFISNTMILKYQQSTFNTLGQEYEKYWNETYKKTRIGAYGLAS